jgi:hypothetical protein
VAEEAKIIKKDKAEIAKLEAKSSKPKENGTTTKAPTEAKHKAEKEESKKKPAETKETTETTTEVKHEAKKGKQQTVESSELRAHKETLAHQEKILHSLEETLENERKLVQQEKEEIEKLEKQTKANQNETAAGTTHANKTATAVKEAGKAEMAATTTTPQARLEQATPA